MSYKLATIFLTIALIITLGALINQKKMFPVEYKVCGVNYTDCSTIARFDDMGSCKTTEEKWSWYCDTITDPMNPKCQVKESNISTSLCSE